MLPSAIDNLTNPVVSRDLEVLEAIVGAIRAVIWAHTDTVATRLGGPRDILYRALGESLTEMLRARGYPDHDMIRCVAIFRSRVRREFARDVAADPPAVVRAALDAVLAGDVNG